MKIFRLFIVFLFVALLVTACNKKQLMTKPDNLIPFDKMVNVMAESYIIESMIYYLPPDSDKVTITRSLYSDLFIRYNINNDQFRISVKYYLAEKNSADKLLKTVSDKIASKRKQFVNEPDEEDEDEFIVK